MPNRFSAAAFARRLVAAREAAGLSIPAAAERSGVHAVSIARFEKSKRLPSLATLYKLAEAYGVAPGELLPPGEPDGDQST